MTSHDAALLDKMTESAGELLFEVSTHEDPFARSLLKELAHQLGRLYGETIRACRAHDGLQDEVTTTFMCGMALEPNFGREEETATDIGAEQLREILKKKAEAAKEKEAKDKATHALYLERFPEHAKMQEEKAKASVKTPGQVLFERTCGPTARPWDKLSRNTHLAYEHEAKHEATDIEAEVGIDDLVHWHIKTSAPAGTKAVAALNAMMRDPTGSTREEGRANLEKWKEATAKEMAALESRLKAKGTAAMEKMLGAPVGTPFTTIDWDKDEEVQAKAVCFKCKGSGNMGFTTYMKCNACE